MKAKILNRKLHRWAAILTAFPILVVMLSGIILQMKKEFDWIQPPTTKGAGKELALGFDRMDVRPGTGTLYSWGASISRTWTVPLQVNALRCVKKITETLWKGTENHACF